eukprot:82268-Rhodomonas_salina.1
MLNEFRLILDDEADHTPLRMPASSLHTHSCEKVSSTIGRVTHKHNSGLRRILAFRETEGRLRLQALQGRVYVSRPSGVRDRDNLGVWESSEDWFILLQDTTPKVSLVTSSKPRRETEEGALLTGIDAAIAYVGCFREVNSRGALWAGVTPLGIC